MRAKGQTKTIFGDEYTYDEVDWCVQVGYPVERGRMSHNEMISGLWNGDERAIHEMREYMDSHEFKHLNSAGRIYCKILHKLDRQGMDNVTDARFVYESIIGLPCTEQVEYRKKAELRFAKFIATIRRRRERKAMRQAA